jgi:hypothetical protein
MTEESSTNRSGILMNGLILKLWVVGAGKTIEEPDSKSIL